MVIMGASASVDKSKHNVQQMRNTLESENNDLKTKVSRLESELQELLQKQNGCNSELRAENEKLKKANECLMKELEAFKVNIQSTNSPSPINTPRKVEKARKTRERLPTPMNDIEAYGKGLNLHEIYNVQGSPKEDRRKKKSTNRNGNGQTVDKVTSESDQKDKKESDAKHDDTAQSASTNENTNTVAGPVAENEATSPVDSTMPEVAVM